MENVIITIARQHGSGGRLIGECLAKKMGIAYYDKELISCLLYTSDAADEL